MKTTVRIEDHLMRELRARARRNGSTFRDALEEVLRRGFAAEAETQRRPKPYRLRPARLGAARLGERAMVKALVLADEIEAAEAVRKIEARK